MWNLINSQIADVSNAHVEAGKYDTAIFEAFKYVEAEIQERIGSRGVGINLINEAFQETNPKILISTDARGIRGLTDLFSGALGSIRNERGHNKKPPIPCETKEDCFLYLAFASLLMYLLDKDKNIFPRIDTIRLYGSKEQLRAELQGNNFGVDSKVLAEGQEVTKLLTSATKIEVLLPENFSGKLKIITSDNKESNEINCDTQAFDEGVNNYYEIIAAEIPLYKDSYCLEKREDVVGIIFKSFEGGVESTRILPVKPDSYNAGYYITYGSFRLDDTVEESWYKDPSSSKICYAWDRTLLFNSEVICESGNFVLGGIAILPKEILTEVDEKRPLKVRGWGKDGEISKDIDITKEVTWRVENNEIAFVDHKGILISKKLGTTKVQCTYKTFTSTANISVGNCPKGSRTTFIQGISKPEQIRTDDKDNLYICNQSEKVYRISPNGNFEEVIRFSNIHGQLVKIDNIAVDKNQNLYVNDINEGVCYKFLWDRNRYVNPTQFATVLTGRKKGIVTDFHGNVFVGVVNKMKGYIIHVKPTGEEVYFETEETPLSLAIDQQGNIVTPAPYSKEIHIYNRNGSLIEKYSHGIDDTPSDIYISNDTIYIAFYRTGSVYSLNKDRKFELFADGFAQPNGICQNRTGNFYISNYSTGQIEKIY